MKYAYKLQQINPIRFIPHIIPEPSISYLKNVQNLVTASTFEDFVYFSEVLCRKNYNIQNRPLFTYIQRELQETNFMIKTTNEIYPGRLAYIKDLFSSNSEVLDFASSEYSNWSLEK